MNMEIRELKYEDFQDYVDLLSQLTVVGEVSEEKFREFVEEQGSKQKTLVLEIDGKIRGCLTILIETKIARSHSKVMHIEDVVTHSDWRGKGISRKLIDKSKEIAKELGCYKIILNCSEENLGFYEHLGFTKKEFGMDFRNF
jgi:glucosamine-phosphate N-acetyltransferase